MKIASKANDFYRELCAQFRTEFLKQLVDTSNWQENVYHLAVACQEPDNIVFTTDKMQLIANLIVDMEDISKAAQILPDEPDMRDVGKPEPTVKEQRAELKALHERLGLRSFKPLDYSPELEIKLVKKKVDSPVPVPSVQVSETEDEGWLGTKAMMAHLGFKTDSVLHKMQKRGQLAKKLVRNDNNRFVARWKVVDETETVPTVEMKETTKPKPRRKPGTPPSDPTKLQPETRQNLQVVTRCLARYPALSRAEICKQTGLVSKKVAYVLDYAKGRDLVEFKGNKWSLTDHGLKCVKVAL